MKAMNGDNLLETVIDSDTPRTEECRQAYLKHPLESAHDLLVCKLAETLQKECASLMRRIGICPVCKEDFQHWIDEPFAQCACGSGEWSFQNVTKEPLVVQLAWVTRERDMALERAEKLEQACVKLDVIIDRIDYACGEPNEMEVPEYCVSRNAANVLERVKATVEELKRLRQSTK